MTLSIIGGGSWGTALAIVLAPRFPKVTLWVFERDLAARMQSTRENDVYLPGFRLPENVEVTTELRGAEFVLGVMPSHFARATYRAAAPYLDPSMTFVSATKGIEQGTLLRMSRVLAETLRFPAPVAVLSGPTFAREIARGDPAAVVIACEDLHVSERVQAAFTGPTLRFYTNSDTIGVEIG